jgi:hypothetical protein
MFISVLWVLEGAYSVIKFSNVVKPQKEIEEYRLGEEVEMKFQGKTFPAKILQKGGQTKCYFNCSFHNDSHITFQERKDDPVTCEFPSFIVKPN